VCFDEWGPLELKPFGGVSWAKQRLARRMRATYRRLKGTEQFFGFFDVHADCLSGKFYKRKRLVELFDAFRRLRKCYTNKRLFVILDNLHGTHDNPRFLALLKKLRIHPVWTPTEASWLNVIEPHFGVMGRFVLSGSDDTEHVQRRRRVYRYLRYRNAKVGCSKHPLTRIRTISVIKWEKH